MQISCNCATLQQCNLQRAGTVRHSPQLFLVLHFFFLSFEFQFELLVLHADNAVIHLH